MKRVLLGILAGSIIYISPSAQAGPIVVQTYTGSFPAKITGTLTNQNTALEEIFTLTSTANLTITTTSYATGGFEPDLLLFNAAGVAVTSGNPFGNPDPNTGIVGDVSLIASNLVAGTYTIALTDFLLNQSLTATNLSAGFTVNYGSGTTFADANGNTRTGNYALNIIATPATTTPEPATFALAIPVLLGLAIAARRRGLRNLQQEGNGMNVRRIHNA